jgi:hypothetical protein
MKKGRDGEEGRKEMQARKERTRIGEYIKRNSPPAKPEPSTNHRDLSLIHPLLNPNTLSNHILRSSPHPILNSLRIPHNIRCFECRIESYRYIPQFRFDVFDVEYGQPVGGWC